jgi:hypothetical protein
MKNAKIPIITSELLSPCFNQSGTTTAGVEDAVDPDEAPNF